MSFPEKIKDLFTKFRREYAVPHSLIVDDMERDVLACYVEAERQWKFYTGKSSACTSCDWSFEDEDPYHIFIQSVKHALGKHEKGCRNLKISALEEQIEEHKQKLQQRIEHLTHLRNQRLAQLQSFYSHLPENPVEVVKEFQAQMKEMIDYTMELENALKELL